jgi:hypothetical protein
MASRTVILTGDKKLNRLLKDLAGKDGKAAVRKAARPALKPVLNAAKQFSPEDEGTLVRSLKIRALKRSRRHFGAQAQTKDGNFKGKTFYGGFQEWGWKQGKRGSAGRKEIQGFHFMLRAAIETRARALAIYRKILRAEIMKRARRKI